MRYKLKTYDKKTYYIEDKEDLFEFFDRINNNRHSLRNIFSDRFDISINPYGGSFKIGEKPKVYYYDDGGCYYTTISVYVEAWYILEDYHGYTVDYEKLFREYKQSRKNKSRKSGKKVGHRLFYRHSLNRSTKRYRKAMKFQDLKESKSSCRKEYSDLIQCKIEGVKVRSKRFDFLRQNHVHFYLDDYHVRKDTTSWKDNKKIKKQWQKRQR